MKYRQCAYIGCVEGMLKRMPAIAWCSLHFCVVAYANTGGVDIIVAVGSLLRIHVNRKWGSVYTSFLSACVDLRSTLLEK